MMKIQAFHVHFTWNFPGKPFMKNYNKKTTKTINVQ